MVNWRRRLEMADIWPKAKTGDVSISELSQVAATRLEALAPFHIQDIDDQKDGLVNDLYHLAKSETVSRDAFDEIWKRLYDWADIDLNDTWPREKVCWVAIR